MTLTLQICFAKAEGLDVVLADGPMMDASTMDVVATDGGLSRVTSDFPDVKLHTRMNALRTGVRRVA